jgi:hypothetical protein
MIGTLLLILIRVWCSIVAEVQLGLASLAEQSRRLDRRTHHDRLERARRHRHGLAPTTRSTIGFASALK